MACLQQARERRLVGGLARALVNDGTVPFEAEPFQRFDNAFRGARLFPWRIDILDAHQPAAALAARLQIAGGRGEQGAEMQWPGGRGREAPDV